MLTLTVALAASLTGCVYLPMPFGGGGPGAGRGNDVRCGGSTVSLDEDGASYKLRGRCPEVLVTGDDVSVDGDDNTVRADGPIGVVTDNGSGNEVEGR